MEPKLSVIVPCYNEGENIPLVLESFRDAIRESDFQGIELILVNNNSKDDSAEILKRELARPEYQFARTVFEPRAGYGAAIKRGLAAARGSVLAWTHADLQTDPGDVFRAYKSCEASEDKKSVVKGNRVGRPLAQVIFSGGMAFIASVMLQGRFFEINAQPKLFPKDFMEHLQDAPDDFSLDLYFLYQAKRFGYTIKTIDVAFKQRLHGESKWAFSFSSKAKTVLRTIKYIAKLRKSVL